MSLETTLWIVWGCVVVFIFVAFQLNKLNKKDIEKNGS